MLNSATRMAGRLWRRFIGPPIRAIDHAFNWFFGLVARDIDPDDIHAREWRQAKVGLAIVGVPHILFIISLFF